jgi:D-proline reductase (dithiol) PrdB
VGLVARELERRGIPTLSMSSARSITRAVHPPRAVFLDFPLGHTAGRAHDAPGNRAILRDTLAAFEAIERPGEIRDLIYAWSDDDGWKEGVMRPHASTASGEADRSLDDDRTERFDEPQYQAEDDRIAAEAALAEGGCPGCVFPE